MYDAYMAELLSRSEQEQITFTVERRQVALDRAMDAPAPADRARGRIPRVLEPAVPTP